MTARPAPPSGVPAIRDHGGIEHCWTAHDGTRLRYAVFPPRPSGPGGPRTVLLPGFSEFIEKYLETIGELQARGHEVLCLDWRGQGLSDRALADRGLVHVETMDDHLADLDGILRASRFAVRDGRRLFLMGHSMGGHLALRAAHRVRPDRLILLSPMVDILPDGVGGRVLRLLVRLAVALGLSRHLVALTPRRGRFEGNRLTRDRRRFRRTLSLVEHDPRLAIVGLTYGWLAAAYASVAALDRELVDPGVPVLILQAGADRIVSNLAQQRLCRRLRGGELRVMAGARHEILSEIDAVRASAWAAIDTFIASGREGAPDQPEAERRQQHDHPDAAQVMGGHEGDVLPDAERDQAHLRQSAGRVGQGDHVPGKAGELGDQQSETGGG